MSETTSAASSPSPARMMSALWAYQNTAAIKAAIELDLFTAIGEGHDSSDSLARKLNASERGIKILCDYMVVLGFLEKHGERYTLTPDSAVFLDRRSPACMASVAGFLTNPDLMGAMLDLTNAVRKGGTTLPQQGTVTDENPVWVQFARDMMPMMFPAAHVIAGMVGGSPDTSLKTLDIAAGHGLFGISVAQHYPNAQVVALDWAPVLEVAHENARKMGVGDRHTLLPGSAFDVEFGDGYDIVLLTNFLHHFDEPTNTRLLKKVHAALKPGGRVFTLEFVPNEDRVSPAMPALFSLVMLASTPSGKAYTFRELEQLFSDAGFSRSEQHPLPPGDASVVVSHK